MKPTWEQVKAFAETDLEAVKPPSPYDIALTMGAALLASGRFTDDMTAAMETAWTCVIPFYQGQRAYLRQAGILQDIAQGSSPAEPEMSAAEARAYVAGETGQVGEVAPGGGVTMRVPMRQLPATETLDIAALTAKSVMIGEATKAVIAAQAVLEEAKHHHQAKPTKATQAAVDQAQAAFDQAAKVQSEAYL